MHDEHALLKKKHVDQIPISYLRCTGDIHLFVRTAVRYTVSMINIFSDNPPVNSLIFFVVTVKFYEKIINIVY